MMLSLGPVLIASGDSYSETGGQKSKQAIW
jgi:hypothetical protein